MCARFSFCASGCRSARAEGAHACRTVKTYGIHKFINSYLRAGELQDKQQTQATTSGNMFEQASNILDLLLFRLPGGLPEKYPPGKPPGGSPGLSGPLPGPSLALSGPLRGLQRHAAQGQQESKERQGRGVRACNSALGPATNNARPITHKHNRRANG